MCMGLSLFLGSGCVGVGCMRTPDRQALETGESPDLDPFTLVSFAWTHTHIFFFLSAPLDSLLTVC